MHNVPLQVTLKFMLIMTTRAESRGMNRAVVKMRSLNGKFDF